jgi:WD40 repeat protein/mono/diheme cytochrome c family protein
MISIPKKLFLSVFAANTALVAAPVDYQKEVFPLLDQYCIECHSEDDSDGDFKADTFKGLMAGGESGVAIVPGKAQESLLVKFLEGRSGRGGKNEFMPPGKRDHLKTEEVAIIRRWIDEGAKAPVETAGVAKPVTRREVVTPKIAPKMAPKRAIQAVAFSEKAQFIAVGRYGEVELVNPVTRAVTRKLTGFRGQVNAVAFSPDGQFVYASGGEAGIAGEVRKWKMTDGAMVREFPGHADACHALAVSSDGKTIATGGYDQRIKLWNAETGAEIKTLRGHNGAIFGLAMRPDGAVLASASADRTVKLWGVPSGNRLDTLSQPTKEQMAVVFSRDGKKLFGAGADNRIRIWSISPTAKEGTNKIETARFAHEGAILNLALSADGTMLASSAADKSVKVWSTADLTEKFVLEKQPDWPQALAFANKTQFVTARKDGTYSIYDGGTGKIVMPPPPPMVELTNASPRAVQSGGEMIFTLSGKNLNAAASAKFSHEGVKGEILPGASATSLRLKVRVVANVPRSLQSVSLANAAGESAKLIFSVDSLPVIATSSDTFKGGPLAVEKLPATATGTLTQTGQQDNYRFNAKAGEIIVFDLGVQALKSKAVTPELTLMDHTGRELAVNRGLDSSSDPFLAFKAPADGEYVIQVSETTLEGSPEHHYCLTMGALPFITAWHPISAQAGSDVCVNLIGHNLTEPKVCFKAAATGPMTVPLDESKLRSRTPLRLQLTSLAHVQETEDNDDVTKAQAVAAPASVNGLLYKTGRVPDADCFSFNAKAGQSFVIETLAAMAGSPADTKIEILDANGKAVPRMLLQAVRDSFINFRSVDADNPDIRLANWEEMDLNEYVYLSGDVSRIFRMPRGPDSGFLFFNAGGKRRAYFDTSATAHSLDEPAYIVQPQPVGADLIPSGLPVFTLMYSNDDAGYRKNGADSHLVFTAPADGKYIARVTDTRGWGGERFVYRMTIREPAPDFTVAVESGKKVPLLAGDATGFSIRANRADGFDGTIEVTLAGVPEGFFASSPLVIEAGHDLASGSLYASPAAKADADWSKLQINACAVIGGKKICKPVSGFKKPALASGKKLLVFLEPDQNGKPLMRQAQELKALEITITPGQTVKAWLRVDRNRNDSLISFDVHNLPHGIIVDNIGLSGVQVREKEDVREIFLAAAKWVPEQDRLIHAAVISARAEQDSAGVQTSFPVLLKVRKPAQVTAR